jgi:hypothetical protein
MVPRELAEASVQVRMEFTGPGRIEGSFNTLPSERFTDKTQFFAY